MIEVEAKAKISNLDRFVEKASKLGKHKGKINKLDNYYTTEPFSQEHYPKKSLRIRKLNGSYQINFKKKISNTHNIYAKKETEFEVSNIQGFLELIKDMGFKKWLTKEKISDIYEITPIFHIELNEVKSLGNFVEVEYLCEEKDIEKARFAVNEVLKKLGIRRKDIIIEGYTRMLWKKRYNK
jgi:predicted adenylyl cyclase CyaB